MWVLANICVKKNLLRKITDCRKECLLSLSDGCWVRGMCVSSVTSSFLKAEQSKLRTNDTEVFVASAQKNLAPERMKICAELWDNGLKASSIFLIVCRKAFIGRDSLQGCSLFCTLLSLHDQRVPGTFLEVGYAALENTLCKGAPIVGMCKCSIVSNTDRRGGHWEFKI